MEKGDRQNGGPERIAGGREPRHGSRPAPGKVTPTSKLSQNRESTVQRKAGVSTSGAAAQQARSAWDHTMDPWMDAAHRGVTALSERERERDPDPVQAHGGVEADDSASVHTAAAAGVSGTGNALPYFDRIQKAFGGVHDLSQVRAHIGGEAAAASEHMGAEAYATGDEIAFRSQPDLHTAAHEAAHVVQQRAGVQLDNGVGRVGDAYERNADAVADAVVRGESAMSLLDVPGDNRDMAAVQGAVQRQETSTQHDRLAHTAVHSKDREANRPDRAFTSLSLLMTTRMSRNYSGSEAREITNKLDWDRGDVFLPKLIRDRVTACVKWYKLVKSGGEWDFKGSLKSDYGSWSKDPMTGRRYNFDIWSNIHYGYVGKACGFPDWALLSGGGVAQLLTNTVPKGYWQRRLKRIGDVDFAIAFDDPHDQAAIKLGFKLWDNHKGGLKIEDLMKGLRTDASELNTRR